mgnify:CR=1 FL=1
MEGEAPPLLGRRVVVYGGGNTAIDAVTQSKRLGARDAAIIYRRSQADMSAYEFEQELAGTDGARFMFNVVVDYLPEDDEVAGTITPSSNLLKYFSRYRRASFSLLLDSFPVLGRCTGNVEYSD